MYSAAVVAGFRGIQRGFHLIAALHLTSYLSPPEVIVSDGTSFDFIVVGGGTAGSVLANRLTESDVSVLLVEAGGNLPIEATVPATMVFLKNSEHDWNFTSEYDKQSAKCHRSSSLDISQGKMVGGTSALNYNLYGRGNAADYDAWAALLGDQLWSWKNVLPYFMKSEKMTDASILNSPDKVYHGTEGNLGVSIDARGEDVHDYLEMMKSLGSNVVLDVNEDHPLGYAKMMFTIANGTRQTTATSYLTPAKDRKNLQVLKGAIVTKINIDSNKRAAGVEVLTEDGKKITIKANKEIIVSAGAFNTPKLLMLSGIGPEKHLKENNIAVVADLPVGQNLHDHVGVNIIQPYMDTAIPRGPKDPRRNPASAVVGYAALDKTQKYPDYETMNFFVDAGDDISTHFCSVILGFKDEICDDVHKNGVGKRAIFIQVLHLKPKSRGEVKLRSSNPLDPPVIHTNYLSDDADLEKMVEFMMDFSRSLNSTFYKSRGVEDATPQSSACGDRSDSRQFWRCYVSCMSSGMSYFSGTSALGGVLDARLRVRGVAGLRVADASVIPVIPSGNIYAPVIMIAEKASDIIKEDNKLM